MRTTRDKLNVLFITVQLETIGGSERLIHSLASQIDRNLFSPSVAYLAGKGVLKEFKELQIPVFPIIKQKGFDILTILEVKKIIELNNIHIVNAHHFMPMVYAFYGSKASNKRSFFYTEHSQWEVQRIPWTWAKIGSYILNKSDGAIGVNQQVAMEMRRKFLIKPEKVFSIMNGVNISEFEKNNYKPSLKAEIGLSPNDKVLGIVANFKKIKNHIFLLKAFNELVKELNDVKLLLIGEGSAEDPENSKQDIQHFIEENKLHKHVLLLGCRSDVPDLLNILDVFCLTSFKEGLPISLIEAMASGLPVVGTDVEGIRDVIIQNKNGFLIKKDDVLSLKNVLHTLLKNESLCKKYGEESKALAKSHYSFSKCIKSYEQLFLRTN